MVNYYQILGISESAHDAEIKAAFKKQAVRFHPDKNPGDPNMEERFKEINRAYQVLSNPYEKARHDLQLKYGAFYQETIYQEPPPPPRQAPAKPYNYAEKEVNWRENWIATAYAFGFTFIVAIVVMTIIGIKNYYDQQKMEELLAARRVQFNEAINKHAAGDLDGTFSIINKLGGFVDREDDMLRFKNDLIEDVLTKSRTHYENAEFVKAIYYYELLENHTMQNNLSNKENLAISYIKSDQPKKSVEILQKLLVLGYRNLFTYVELAKIHRDHLGNKEQALVYFERANEVAKEYYTNIYGKAYIVVLSQENLSEVHWELYNGLAKLYLDTGQPEKALSALRWNIRVWPDRIDNYVIAAQAHGALGENDLACEQAQWAMAIDPEVALQDYCL